MNLPNKITTIRLILIPIFIAVFYIDFSYHYLVAAGVFAMAAFTDFLDGYFARKYNMVTDLGKFLDANADKVLVLAAVVLFVDAHLLPYIWGGVAVSIIIAREIMISCLRMIAATKGIVMAADKLGKIKTFLQDVSICVLLGAFGIFGNDYSNVMYIIGIVIFGLSVVMTVVSGINYLVVNRKALSGVSK
ncbi:MAG: CDP-diacylglycerol--glycerol-3-phosphate 3-phosphatidyltransferase [Clostridia bacterium]|nr:CDP-diacylglycerol--glycerol-3-phosphate 3-phosphatidyltransferase [Clostridia bacterium]